MPDTHARLSPSAANRWINCPFSVEFSKNIPSKSSFASEEGTLAHSLAECYLKYDFDQITKTEYNGMLTSIKKDKKFNKAMESYVDSYAEIVESIYNDLGNEAKAYFEVQVEMFEDCWGTSDVVLDNGREIYVIDLKYGRGVPVSAIDNPQLKLYGYGAWKKFGSKATDIYTTIIQPRITGGFSQARYKADEVNKWVNKEVLPSARATNFDTCRPNPDGTTDRTGWCRWCPAKNKCRRLLAKEGDNDV